MIKFFRQIRKKLVAGNQVKSYLLYAFGEIALVVIGILIALQVNNWNEHRLEQNKEQKILLDLKVEFDTNHDDLVRVRNAHQLIINELTELQRMSIATEYNDEVLDSLMLLSVKWFTFTARPGASDNIINSGNLDIISNKELRDKINQWPGIVDEVIDDEVFTADFIKDTFLPFVAKHYPMTNLEYPHLTSWVKKLDISTKFDLTPIVRRKELDWKQLLNDFEFQSLVSARKIYEVHCWAEVEKALIDCESILVYLNKEIQNEN